MSGYPSSLTSPTTGNAYEYWPDGLFLHASAMPNGGGTTGQTEAVRLGLARALLSLNGDWTSALRKHGLLTRDARIKERKKPGLKRARKAPTYTKR